MVEIKTKYGKFGIKIKTDFERPLLFYTDSYTKDQYHIMFDDVVGKHHEFHLSMLIEVFDNVRRT